jgi:ADP-ribose pyrophosphatase YjhB (NUDIX family)
MPESPCPDTTQVVCANVVRDEQGRLLLVRESKASALGRWSLPAGRLQVGESIREGAAREAFEETGLTVDVGPLLGIYHCPSTLEGGSAIIFVFRSAVTGGEIRASREHPEAVFVSRTRVDELLGESLVRGQHVRAAIDVADAGTELPTHLISQVAASPRPRVKADRRAVAHPDAWQAAP